MSEVGFTELVIQHFGEENALMQHHLHIDRFSQIVNLFSETLDESYIDKREF